MAKSPRERNQYIETWQREHIKRITVKLNKSTDADIIERLEHESSVQGYLKRLVREDIIKSG